MTCKHIIIAYAIRHFFPFSFVVLTKHDKEREKKDINMTAPKINFKLIDVHKKVNIMLVDNQYVIVIPWVVRLYVEIIHEL